MGFLPKSPLSINRLSNATMSSTELIPGIYNYCDRWCERCPFTQRCAIFDPDDQEQIEPGTELFDFLDDLHPQVWLKLEEKLAPQEIRQWKDQLRAYSLRDTDPRQVVEVLDLGPLSRSYFRSGHHWIKQHCDALLERAVGESPPSRKSLRPGEKPGLHLVCEVIQWYLFFIGAKVERALGGMDDPGLLEIFGRQNDANGSAKIALLAIDRSLTAWELVRTSFPGGGATTIELMLLLAKLRLGLKKLFPHTDKFIRPGFDEMGAHASDY